MTIFKAMPFAVSLFCPKKSDVCSGNPTDLKDSIRAAFFGLVRAVPPSILKNAIATTKINAKGEKIMLCPKCNHSISDKKVAKYLASKGGSKKKKFSEEEIAKRTKRLAEARKVRHNKGDNPMSVPPAT